MHRGDPTINLSVGSYHKGYAIEIAFNFEALKNDGSSMIQVMICNWNSIEL